MNDKADIGTTEKAQAATVDPLVMPRVSVLCAAQRSIYHDLEGVEVYDRNRDAWTFAGDTPIVAHPPCRAWSVKEKHQAKPALAEKELGLWCCQQLRVCGGVLEQPAFSELFAAAGFPTPGERIYGEVWTLEVWQAWWGHRMRKATWLAFCGIEPSSVHVPFCLVSRQGSGKRRWYKRLSKQQRSATPKLFAEWLVSLARLAV